MACPPQRSTRRSEDEPRTLQEKIARLLAEGSDGLISITLRGKPNAEDNAGS